MDVEPISGTTLDFSRLGRTPKREHRREVRSARREERREEGREKIEENVEGSKLETSPPEMLRMSSQMSGVRIWDQIKSKLAPRPPF